MAKPDTSPELPNASLLRRTAAMVYDAFLIAALLMIGTFGAVSIVGQGTAVGGLWFQLFLYLLVMGFYIMFWRIKGQSLGMQVWRIRAVNEHGAIMGYGQCVLRFLAATVSFCAGFLGFLWILVDAKQLAWHDRLSRTRVVYLGSKPYDSERRQMTNPPADKDQ
ncbi:MAG: RDD family protein [Gammaproteobacteria bacterium]|nr:RDD family protein [Gammaproteobacteria bacterium]MBS03112.1 RDD family protein [Gammaproteobacteria bacterium]